MMNELSLWLCFDLDEKTIHNHAECRVDAGNGPW